MGKGFAVERSEGPRWISYRSHKRDPVFMVFLGKRSVKQIGGSGSGALRSVSEQRQMQPAVSLKPLALSVVLSSNQTQESKQTKARDDRTRHSVDPLQSFRVEFLPIDTNTTAQNEPPQG